MRRARGFTIIEVMIAGTVMAIMGLAMAELFSWMSKSSKYNKVFNTRTALDGILKNAAINPRILCRSVNRKVAITTDGMPVNPNVAGNEWFSNCVTARTVADGGPTADMCFSWDATHNYERQPLELWDASGTEKISGRAGDEPGATGTAEVPVLYDSSGAQGPCKGETALSDKCPLKVVSWFRPVCPGNAPNCAGTGDSPAAYVEVGYRLDVFDKIAGGAPMQGTTNATTRLPIEIWKIASACNLGGGAPGMCPPGQFMAGLNPTTGGPVCRPTTPPPPGATNSNQCGLGEVLVGYEADWKPKCLQANCEDRKASSPGAYLFGGFNSDGTKNCLKVDCPAGSSAKLASDPSGQVTSSCVTDVKRQTSIVTYHSAQIGVPVTSPAGCIFLSPGTNLNPVPNTALLWKGKSFGGSFAGDKPDNYPGISQDLSSPGSCLDPYGELNNPTGNAAQQLNAAQFLARPYTVRTLSRDFWSYWLIGAVPPGGVKPFKKVLDIFPWVSGCQVCEVPGPVVTFQHRTTCPTGWKLLWNGYTLMAAALLKLYESSSDGTRNVSNDLGGPGACLPRLPDNGAPGDVGPKSFFACEQTGTEFKCGLTWSHEGGMFGSDYKYVVEALYLLGPNQVQANAAQAFLSCAVCYRPD